MYSFNQNASRKYDSNLLGDASSGLESAIDELFNDFSSYMFLSEDEMETRREKAIEAAFAILFPNPHESNKPVAQKAAVKTPAAKRTTARKKPATKTKTIASQRNW